MNSRHGWLGQLAMTDDDDYAWTKGPSTEGGCEQYSDPIMDSFSLILYPRVSDRFLSGHPLCLTVQPETNSELIHWARKIEFESCK